MLEVFRGVALAAGGRELTPLTSIPLGPVERSVLAQRGYGSVLGDILPSDQRVFLPSFVFLLVIVVLLVRPAGLFAPLRTRTVERV